MYGLQFSQSPALTAPSYLVTISTIIAKIVRTLWLAERRVCMRVCKHGCDVKMFCFSRANHVSTNLKKFLSSKLDKVTLLFYPFLRQLKLGKSLQTSCVNFFALKLTFFFLFHLFAKQGLITRVRLRVQDFGTGKYFCFNQCHNKEFLSVFLSKVIYKSNRKLFSCVCIAWYILDRYANPRFRLGFACITVSNPSCLYQAMQTRKTFSIV